MGATQQVDIAAQSLSTCVVELRGRPWKYGTRTGAIAGLGRLKADIASPVLIEDLVDDNPAIVREAARSLVSMLGLQLTVSRIAEAATRNGPASADAWGRALRWLDRQATAEELGALMASGAPNQREIARARWRGGFRETTRAHQTDQAFTRRMLDDAPLRIEDVQAFSEVVGQVMVSTMNYLQPGQPPPSPR